MGPWYFVIVDEPKNVKKHGKMVLMGYLELRYVFQSTSSTHSFNLSLLPFYATRAGPSLAIPDIQLEKLEKREKFGYSVLESTTFHLCHPQH